MFDCLHILDKALNKTLVKILPDNIELAYLAQNSSSYPCVIVIPKEMNNLSDYLDKYEIKFDVDIISFKDDINLNDLLNRTLSGVTKDNVKNNTLDLDSKYIDTEVDIDLPPSVFATIDILSLYCCSVKWHDSVDLSSMKVSISYHCQIIKQLLFK